MKPPASMTRRLSIAAACIIATQLGVMRLQYETELEADRGVKCDVTTLPDRLGEWSGSALEVKARIVEQVGGLSSIDRVYVNPEGRRVFVHMASFRSTDTALPHSPELCYTGTGWKILQNDWWRYGDDRRFRWMTVEREGMQAGLAYWYQLGEPVASDREELRQILQKLRWRSGAWPPLLKVLLHVPLETTEDEAKKIAEDLSGRIYAWVLGNSGIEPAGPLAMEVPKSGGNPHSPGQRISVRESGRSGTR